jgi:hypothetical protein
MFITNLWSSYNVAYGLHNGNRLPSSIWIENNMSGAKRKCSNDQTTSAWPTSPSVSSPTLHSHHRYSLHYGGSFCSPAIIRIPVSCVPILLSDTHWWLVWLCLEAKSWARVCSLEARARPCSVEPQQLVSHDVVAKLRPLVLICPLGHPIFELLYDIRGLLPLRIKTRGTGFLSLKIESPPHKCCLYIHHNHNEYGYEDNRVFVLSRPRLCICYAFFKHDLFGWELVIIETEVNSSSGMSLKRE